MKAAVADAPPVDDATRARLRAMLAVPAGEQPAPARTGEVAA
ncbi:hypothetical protein [Pseudonocardia ammonioxydans]|nr:hypothetical protein [Pseudonocardia ammonioxydans]